MSKENAERKRELKILMTYYVCRIQDAARDIIGVIESQSDEDDYSTALAISDYLGMYFRHRRELIQMEGEDELT